MTDHPLVSVVIPTYRRNKELAKAVESAENQSYGNIEIIVVNDAPDDEIPEKISEKSIVTIVQHEENKCGAAARNTGLEEAKGEYIAFLDDDDFFDREKIEKQVRKMEATDEDCFGCFTWHFFYSSREELAGDEKEVIAEDTEDMVYRLLRGFDIRIGGCTSLLLKKKALEEINGFDKRFPRHQDWELLLRVVEKGEMEVVDEPLFSKIGYTEPRADKLEKAKRLYLKKFSEKIKSLPKDKERRIYRDNYSKLSEAFFREDRNLKGILWFLKALKYTENLSAISYSEWPPRIDNRA
jgi:glycosyltransferase involved in cell wall biosynthesis